MIKSMIFIVVSSFLILLTGCGLHTLSAFGSCDKWEIYSEKSQVSKIFMMDICASKLGYSYNSFNMKNTTEIQNMVYPKLVDLIYKYPSLKECQIQKESIKYGFGAGGSPLEATVICPMAIKFTRKEGRFFMTSFPYSQITK